MNILFITVRSDTGGGPKHVHDLVKTLQETKPEVKCFIASPTSPPFEESFKSQSEDFLEIPHRGFSLIKLFLMFILCLKHDIKIIHSHGRGAGYYSRVLGLFGLKVVHTFHGAHFERSIPGRIKLFIDSSLKFITDKFINVSIDELSTSIEMNINEVSKAMVIPNGIDYKGIKREFDSLSTEAMRKEFSIPEGKRVWGTLSRLSYQKGLDLFLDFDLPKDVVFIIAGEGEVKANLHSKNDNENIIFIGNVKKPIHFLRSLDGYFSSSRWEGLPLSVLEAMSCGLPCLLSNVDGHRELDGVELFNLNDNQDFNSKFFSIDTNNLGKKAIATVEKEYTLEKMTNSTYRIYRHL